MAALEDVLVKCRQEQFSRVCLLVIIINNNTQIQTYNKILLLVIFVMGNAIKRKYEGKIFENI